MPKKLRKPRLPIAPLPAELRTRGNADLRLMRLIVNFAGVWIDCYPACRRAGRCAHPLVPCFDPNADALHDMFVALTEWPRFDGPRDPEEDAAPVTGDLFD